jgi:hypothetical protein
MLARTIAHMQSRSNGSKVVIGTALGGLEPYICMQDICTVASQPCILAVFRMSVDDAAFRAQVKCVRHSGKAEQRVVHIGD